MQGETLADLLAPLAPEGITQTPLDGLILARFSEPMARRPVVYGPSLCVVAQGSKRAHLGDRTFTYDADNFLVCSLTLPVDSEIPEATEASPFLGLVLTIDTGIVGQILLEMDSHVEWPETSEASIVAGPITPNMHHAITRLVRMIDDPMSRKVLAPGLIREALYEVLRGPHGHVLRDIVLRDSSAHRVSRVVRFIEENYQRPLSIEEISRHASMSSSALHHHFKQATTMSPMQFVKKLRLHQARTMLLSGRSAGETAFEVGYGSPSQFSREFRRFFGVAPTQVRAAT